MDVCLQGLCGEVALYFLCWPCMDVEMVWVPSRPLVYVVKGDY